MNDQETRQRRRSRRSPKVTVKEVAAAAGVSMMTVSNVVHHRANVSGDVRRKVQKVIKDLGYVPSKAAQELAGSPIPHVGLLYPAIINPFIAAVIVGSLRAAARLKMEVTVQLAQLDDPQALRDTINRMEDGGTDGFLLPSPIAEFAAKTFEETPLTVPAVALAPGIPIIGMSSVRSDERQAAYELVTMLAKLGHVRIGHIAGPETQSASIARLQGYAAAMQFSGLEAGPALIARSTTFSFQDGLVAAERLLDLSPRVTAIFAGNDTLAASVLASAQKRGIRVPAELSVVGYDDSPVAEQLWPGLTTVHQDAQLMAERAIEILEHKIKAWREDGNIPVEQDAVLPYQIVQRGSCGPAPQI